MSQDLFNLYSTIKTKASQVRPQSRKQSFELWCFFPLSLKTAEIRSAVSAVLSILPCWLVYSRSAAFIHIAVAQ